MNKQKLVDIFKRKPSASDDPGDDALDGSPDDDDMAAEPAGADDDGVIGDLVQSGLTHEQSQAIVDAIHALSGAEPDGDDSEDDDAED